MYQEEENWDDEDYGATQRANVPNYWDDDKYDYSVAKPPVANKTKNASNVSSTSAPSPQKPVPTMVKREPKKVEMHTVGLPQDKKDIVMDTLRLIHGPNLKLKDPSSYKDRDKALERQYWMDKGPMVLKECFDYSNEESKKVNYFAKEKLEKCGYYTAHCVEALKKFSGKGDEFETALSALFPVYFGVKARHVPEACLKDMDAKRRDELQSLQANFGNNLKEVTLKKYVFEFELAYLSLWSQKPKKPTQRNRGNSSRGRQICHQFASRGACRFGDKCKYSHEKAMTFFAGDDDSDLDKLIFIFEVRFPQDCKYPYDVPLMTLESKYPGIPAFLCLRITKFLTNVASNLCEYGEPFCTRLIYALQDYQEVEEFLNSNAGCMDLVDPDKPLFPVEQDDTSSGSPSKKFCNNRVPSMTFTSMKYRNGESQKSVQQIDAELVDIARRKLDNRKYHEMLESRRKLPTWRMKDEIVSTIKSNSVVVISGETGCGKSTQVPQFLLDDWLSSHNPNDPSSHVEIICTQPRRISAMSVAKRVAQERLEQAGDSVGYQIRLESKVSQFTRLTFCTIGILLRKLEYDHRLSTTTHVIVDEVHERSEDSDFLVLILKDLLEVRPDLKIILMSATMNAELFANYYQTSKVITIPGKVFPVNVIYLEELLGKVNYRLDEYSKNSRSMTNRVSRQLDTLMRPDYSKGTVHAKQSTPDEALDANGFLSRYKGCKPEVLMTLFCMDVNKIDTNLVTDTLVWIVNGNHNYPRQGSVLVFLPGIAEIMALHDQLLADEFFCRQKGRVEILPLHSSISPEDQYKVFKDFGKNVRKIVLATNIAETSITIDDCVYVVDCGKMKQNSYSSYTNMTSLEEVWISQANATQRAGRAGRVMPGVCIRLYTKHRHDHMFDPEPVAEIKRVPLDQIVLKIKSLANFEGKEPEIVLKSILEPPYPEQIEKAINSLQVLGALDVDSNLTALGKHLSVLPVDVRIGKLLIFGSIFSCVDSILTIAATLSTKSPFVSPYRNRDEAQTKKKNFEMMRSDHLTTLNAYEKWLEEEKRGRGNQFASDNFMSSKTLRMIGEVKWQLLELLIGIGFISLDEQAAKRRRRFDNILEETGTEVNVNGRNHQLLTSLICAALYPNVVKILTPDTHYSASISGAIRKDYNPEDLSYKTHDDGYVYLHPSSVNFRQVSYDSPYLVFQERMQTNKVYVHDSTMVSPLSLILFSGSDIKIELASGQSLITLDHDWITFTMTSHEDAEMLQLLREALASLLEEKIKHPEINLSSNSTHKKIINTIIKTVAYK